MLIKQRNRISRYYSLKRQFAAWLKKKKKNHAARMAFRSPRTQI